MPQLNKKRKKNPLIADVLDNYQFKTYLPQNSKQEKTKLFGIYINKDTKKEYVVKQSLNHKDDDFSEVLFSKIINGIFAANPADETSNLFANYGFVIHSQDMHPYILSRFIEEFLPLKDLAVKLNKEHKHLKKYLSIKQKEQLADILVGCLFGLEYDCHPGNIGISKSGDIVKIDHGWSLYHICDDQKTKINLNQIKNIFRDMFYRHGFKPSNHFKDYLYIINTDLFTSRLKIFIDKVTLKEDLIEQIITEGVNDLVAVYKQCNENLFSDISQRQNLIIKQLINFCNHIGVSSSYLKVIADQSLEEKITMLQKIIINSLTNSFLHRVQLMRDLYKRREQEVHAKFTKKITKLDHRLTAVIDQITNQIKKYQEKQKDKDQNYSKKHLIIQLEQYYKDLKYIKIESKLNFAYKLYRTKLIVENINKETKILSPTNHFRDFINKVIKKLFRIENYFKAVTVKDKLTSLELKQPVKPSKMFLPLSSKKYKPKQEKAVILQGYNHHYPSSKKLKRE